MKIADISVEYKDHMGTDLDIVDAARVSFDKESDWEYDTKDVDVSDGYACGPSWVVVPDYQTKRLSAADTKLINYLAKHKHWSPFAHTSLKLRIKAPIFVARQLVKHQVGFVWNEVSRRYVDAEPEFYFPDIWRSRPDASIKQGSGSEEITQLNFGFCNDNITPDLRDVKAEFSRVCDAAIELYNKMVESNVAPEQARMVLPQNMMTEWIWSGSVYAFNRVCTERLNPHAQKETRDVAIKINEICREYFPVSWKALEENR